ncbi:type II toxin-antitoxin system ParD family antitoxin [Nitrosomonas aestuarii]|uniref:type II toxin-antitoxin system ParD family antitoxin n=1 Tax=Nitrosomonas aestuarii TaxID=52441 RepID=UPI000D31D7C8|nr:type II toxin-antitoxin system ParD family antitoxin [Nitrosomonas aestuarii]PTN10771.1 antitoxin ParD1/3/4 [Nitrosomonas aestuarii]
MLAQKNTNVKLGEHFEKFLAHQVETGRYGSASVVIRTGPRLLEERGNSLETLRHTLIEGEQSGTSDYLLQSILDDLDSED